MEELVQMKNVLNLKEKATESRLETVAAPHGARVFPKVGVSDVLPIDGSGISDQLFDYALRAHFDFVVTDEETLPLFSVEYDGPSHQLPVVRRRDAKKNALCKRFDFPLLRLKTTYLHELGRKKDLLTWFVEVWFAAESFYDAQERGHVPLDEPFAPWAVRRAGSGDPFPLKLSAKPLRHIRKCFNAGLCADRIPSRLIARDGHNDYRGISFMRVDERTAIATQSGMMYQQFPVLESDALDEILIVDICRRLDGVLEGDEEAESVEEVSRTAKEFANRYDIVAASMAGGVPGISLSF